MQNILAQTIFVSDFFLSERPGTFRSGLWRSRKKTGGPRWLQVFLFLTFTGIAASAAHGQGQLAFAPATANFGNVAVGSSKTIQVVIKNTSSMTAVVMSENLNGGMYTVGGITPPMLIAPGANVVMSIKFEPTRAGSVPGSVIVGSGVRLTRRNIATGLINYSLSGTGVAGVALQAFPGGAAFGNVPLGTTTSRAVQLKNPGTGSATISSVSVSGAGFSTSGLPLPLTLAAGGTKNFMLTFKPTAIGMESGAITLKSKSGAPELTLDVSGTGLTAAPTISASAAGLAFGNAVIGSAEKLAVTLTNTGNSNVTISGVSVTGAGATSFSSGLSGSTIAPGQTATLNVTFAPTTAQLLNGSVKISSNATNSPTVIALSGTGVPATGHSTGGAQSVSLSWDASTSSGVVGYNVYRATSPGSPFAKLVNSTISELSYTDDTVESGKTYTYVVSAMNSAGEESAYSQSVTVVIP